MLTSTPTPVYSDLEEWTVLSRACPTRASARPSRPCAHAIMMAHADWRTVLAGSIIVDSEAKAASEAAGNGENITPYTTFQVGIARPVLATPSCLAAEELLQRVVLGKVGTVACVLHVTGALHCAMTHALRPFGHTCALCRLQGIVV